MWTYLQVISFFQKNNSSIRNVSSVKNNFVKRISLREDYDQINDSYFFYRMDDLNSKLSYLFLDHYYQINHLIKLSNLTYLRKKLLLLDLISLYVFSCIIYPRELNVYNDFLRSHERLTCIKRSLRNTKKSKVRVFLLKLQESFLILKNKRYLDMILKDHRKLKRLNSFLLDRFNKQKVIKIDKDIDFMDHKFFIFNFCYLFFKFYFWIYHILKIPVILYCLFFCDLESWLTLCSLASSFLSYAFDVSLFCYYW